MSSARLFLDALTRQGVQEDLRDALVQYLQWAEQDPLLDDLATFVQDVTEEFEEAQE